MARKSREVWKILPSEAAGAEKEEGEAPPDGDKPADEVVWFTRDYETEQPRKQARRRNNK